MQMHETYYLYYVIGLQVNTSLVNPSGMAQCPARTHYLCIRHEALLGQSRIHQIS
jgi:hypothetical protein